MVNKFFCSNYSHPGSVFAAATLNHSVLFLELHWPKPEHDLIVAEMSVIVDGQDGLGFHGVPGKEAVVEAVLFCADNLQAQDEI